MIAGGGLSPTTLADSFAAVRTSDTAPVALSATAPSPFGGTGTAFAAVPAAPRLAARRCWQGDFLLPEVALCRLSSFFACDAVFADDIGAGSCFANSSVITSLSADDLLA